jgi:chaperonin GroES
MAVNQKLVKYIDETNIAETLDEKELVTMGSDCSRGYKTDLDSRKAWEELLEKWTKLALQVAEKKSYPWREASNVKFPLLATAAMQFAARAYPSLVPSNGQVVKCKTYGFDRDGQKAERAERISRYMSYQLMEQMEEWEEDMDKLLLTLPIAGTVFKKTYFDSSKQRNKSCLVMPKNLVVNYWTKSIEDAERLTEIIPMTKRKLKEQQMLGLFLDVELGTPKGDSSRKEDTTHEMIEPELDDTTPYTLLEQHTFLDLDKDGYAEPYIVTFEEETHKVLRIVARYTNEGLKVDEKGNLILIEPVQYYTKFGFVPNPDGGFYDIGFGRLLGPLNESVDTIINQLIDSGTLSNLQSGFLGKGLRIKVGEVRFAPGEWKTVNATGDDLKKQIFPMPVREPSAVLMNLLQYMITSGKELASVADIFVGKMPGQNTPATTTMASIEQGMKVFTAVYKRIYRSMTKEFRKLYLLNRQYANPEEYLDFLDEPITQNDFEGSENDISPAADPNASSSQEKQAKVQALGQLLQLQTINPMEFTKRYLEAFEVPAPEQLIAQPQQQQGPSPEEQQAMMEQEAAQQKMRMEEAKMQMRQASDTQKAQIEQRISENKLLHTSVMGDLKVKQAMQKHAVNLSASQMSAAMKGNNQGS